MSVIMLITKIIAFISWVSKEESFFMGGCAMTSRSGFSRVKAMPGSPSSNRFIHRICRAVKGKGRPKIRLTPIRMVSVKDPDIR